MADKKLNIGFDLTDKSNVLQQSICRMLSATSRDEESLLTRYYNIYGQVDIAEIDSEIKSQLSSIISDKERHHNKLFDIAKVVGCEIYQSNGEEIVISKGKKPRKA